MWVSRLIVVRVQFKFLLDNKSEEHVYYRWKLFSLLQVCPSSLVPSTALAPVSLQYT